MHDRDNSVTSAFIPPGDRVGTRRLQFRALLAFVLLFAVMMYFAVWFDRVKMAPIRAGRHLEQHILSLRDRRPASLTPRQWESAVAWTCNLHGNSLIMFQATAPEIRDLSQRLDQRLSAEADLGTIFWIWDEYLRICPGGAKYQRFRAQMVEEIEAGGADWNLPIR